MKLSDLVAGDGAALLSSTSGAAGEVRTEQFDVDLKRRNGQSLPVRLLHRVAFGHDRTPGPSRTLVINRAPGEEQAEDLRAAEVRFARFFNQTPMAIAAVDNAGHITRANAAFAKLCPRAHEMHDLYAGVADRDHEQLRAALAAAMAGKSEIVPVDAAPIFMRSTQPNSARCKKILRKPRRCRPSASSPVALRMTSTMC